MLCGMQMTTPIISIFVLILNHMQEDKLQQITKIYVTLQLMMNIDILIGNLQCDEVKRNL